MVSHSLHFFPQTITLVPVSVLSLSNGTPPLLCQQLSSLVPRSSATFTLLTPILFYFVSKQAVCPAWGMNSRPGGQEEHALPTEAAKHPLNPILEDTLTCPLCSYLELLRWMEKSAWPKHWGNWKPRKLTGPLVLLNRFCVSLLGFLPCLPEQVVKTPDPFSPPLLGKQGNWAWNSSCALHPYTLTYICTDPFLSSP